MILCLFPTPPSHIHAQNVLRIILTNIPAFKKCWSTWSTLTFGNDGEKNLPNELSNSRFGKIQKESNLGERTIGMQGEMAVAKAQLP
jgi:hypothetical protein